MFRKSSARQNDYLNIACTNADGNSIIRANAAPGRYILGFLQHKEFKHILYSGIVDTETMTMPVVVNDWFPELSRMYIVLQSVAMAILNDRVEIPETPVMPDRFSAHVFEFGANGDMGSEGVITDTKPRHYLPLFHAPIGMPYGSYTLGMECLTKIAKGLNDLGFDYKYTKSTPGCRPISKLPGWCPDPFQLQVA